MKNVLDCQITSTKNVGTKCSKSFHIVVKYYYTSIFGLSALKD